MKRDDKTLVTTTWRAVFLFSVLLIVLSTIDAKPALSADDILNASANRQDDKEVRDAVNGALKRCPWYSTSDDAVRFLPQRPIKERRVAEHDHIEEPKLPAKGDGGAFWAIVSTFMLAILALVGWYAYHSFQLRSTRRKFQLEEELRRQRRVETLADEAKVFYDDLRSATLDARARGDFRSATIFLFSWILVELDKREFILLDKGKTNLEYYRELNGCAVEQSIYCSAMTEFERVYFGGQPTTRDEFESRLYVLIDSFEDAMTRYDEIMRQQSVATSVAQQSATSQQFHTMSFLLGTLLAISLTALGCGEEYWRDAYESPALLDNSRSMNSLSAFVHYCDSKIKGGMRSTSRCIMDDPSVDTIIWLGPATTSDDFGAFTMVKPHVFAISDEGSQKARREAFKANLERYANCVPERDWKEFYVPSSNRQLYGTESGRPIGFTPDGSDPSSIEDWLNEKPNRVFVCVFSEWNATVEYWENALEDVKANAPSDKRGLYIAECKTQIERARTRRDETRLTALHFKDELSQRREVAIQKLAKEEQLRIDAGGLEKDEIEFDDSSNDEYFDWFELAADSNDETFFTYGDVERRGVDFGDDWSDSSEDTHDRPNVDKVWCRSLFIDDDVKREPKLHAKFTGAPDWVNGLDSAPLREWTTLAPAEGTETLVALDDVPIICRRRVGKSQMIFINSTSILSNYALTERTNRVLVERLVREFNPDGRAQLALYNLHQDLEESESGYKPKPGPFSLTKASPYTIMVWHFVALAFFIAFAAWPIWGRAKRLVVERNNNFGRHIGAIARILKTINAVDWSREQVNLWRSSQIERNDLQE